MIQSSLLDRDAQIKSDATWLTCKSHIEIRLGCIIAKTAGLHTGSRGMFEKIFDDIIEDGCFGVTVDTLVLAMDITRPLGVGVIWHAASMGLDEKIASCYVKEEFRRQGIGTALIEKACLVSAGTIKFAMGQKGSTAFFRSLKMFTDPKSDDLIRL